MGNAAVDEDELDEELAELQQEQLDAKMINTGSVPVGDQISGLPAAPLTDVKGRAPAKAIEEDDDDAELRKLQAEMAM